MWRRVGAWAGWRVGVAVRGRGDGAWVGWLFECGVGVAVRGRAGLACRAWMRGRVVIRGRVGEACRAWMRGVHVPGVDAWGGTVRRCVGLTCRAWMREAGRCVGAVVVRGRLGEARSAEVYRFGHASRRQSCQCGGDAEVSTDTVYRLATIWFTCRQYESLANTAQLPPLLMRPLQNLPDLLAPSS